ncbi:MAG: CHASE3 domain-containing protein [Proteobacteria bacterium]|nr:CHASE3 domain-containing protein [Pseudomonadota bacterium]
MRKFAQAIRSEGVPRTIGKLAIATFALGALMSVFSVISALRIRSELVSAFSEVAAMRIEQEATHELLSRVIDAETALRGFGLIGEDTFLEPYTRAKLELPFLELRITKNTVPGGPSRARFDTLLKDAMTTIDASIVSARKAWPSTDGLRADVVLIKTKLDRLREEERSLSALLTERLDVRRARAGEVISKLLFATVILAIGLVLLAFSQLREMAIQAARYLTFESAKRAEISDLNREMELSRQELESLHRQLSLALRSASIQVFTLTPEAQIDWVADPQSHVAPLRSAPQNLAALASPADRPALLGALEAVFERGEARDLELKISDPQGHALWLRLHFAPPGGAAGEADFEHHILGCAFDITALKEREENNFWLMRELSHRSKNLLAIVQSIARQTGRTTADKQAFLARFAPRLQALAAAHDLLVTTDYAGADLVSLIRSQMGGSEGLIGTRITLEGPSVTVRAEAAQNLGMALHELFSNAQTHGALRNALGTLAIRWHVEAEGVDPMLVLDWQEINVPPVEGPPGTGFGDVLIRVNLPRSLDGKVTLDHLPEGTRCHMRLPLRRLRPEYAGHA